MIEKKRTLEEVVSAIEGSGGIKTVIAKRLGVSRPSINAYLKQWSTAQAAYDNETQVNLDVAESVIVMNMRNANKVANAGGVADTGDVWKYLKLKGKDRGYVERKEIYIELTNADMESMTDDELRAIYEA